ncbi:MAG: phosphatase PAP2 family protein [bacterium]|nr:phosphatase PAP2 family protein [bacterium]
MLENFIQLDGNILLWIQEYVRNDVLTPVFKFITHLGDSGMIWIVLSLLLLISRKTRKVGLASLLALLFSLLVNNGILKNLVARTRPYDVVNGLQLLIERQTDFSFPSGHTGSSFAAAVVMFHALPRKYGVPALVLAFLIALSRLYVGVHYPTDVIFAACSGTVLGILAYRVTDVFWDRVVLSRKVKS